jgi:hypothetical protein
MSTWWEALLSICVMYVKVSNIEGRYKGKRDFQAQSYHNQGYQAQPPKIPNINFAKSYLTNQPTYLIENQFEINQSS